MLEEVGSALFVLGVACQASEEVHREDFWVKREIVVQLRRDKSLVGIASAMTLIIDVVDNDGSVRVTRSSTEER